MRDREKGQPRTDWPGGGEGVTDIRRALNEIVARNSSPLQALLHPVGLLILGIALGDAVAQISISLLILASIAVAAFNILVVYRFNRSRTRSVQTAYWHAWFVAGAALNGLVWGVGGVILFRPDAGFGLSFFFVPLMLAGFGGGYVAWRSASPLSVIAFVSLSLGPLIAELALLATADAFALAGILSLYVALLGLLCLNNYQALLEATALRLVRDRIDGQLRESVSTLSKITANMPGLVFQAALRPEGGGHFTYVSDGLAEIFGLAPDAVKRSLVPMLERVDLRDRDRVRFAMWQRGSTLTLWSDEFRVHHPEKGEIWVEVQASPERGADGGTVWYGAMRETTEHRRLLDRIRVQAAAMDAADTGIVILDALDGGAPIIYANSAFESMVGAKSDGVLGRTLEEFVDSSGTDERPAILADALRKGPKASLRLRFRRPHGDPFWVELRLSETVTADGYRSYYTVIIADITERLRIEADLKASEARYRSIVEDQVDLICRFKPDTTLTYVNPAYAHAFGRSIEDLIGRPFIALLPPADRARALAHLSRVTPADSVRSFEYRIVRPDGSICWQYWTDRAFFNDEGDLIEFQSIGRDITDRKRIEAELKASEARYRSIVEQHLDMIVRFTPDTRVTFANEIYCRQVGVPFDKIAGYRFIDHVPEDERETVLAHYASFTPEHPWKTFEHHVALPDGRWRLHQWTDRAVFDDNGNVLEIQSIGRDITDEKERQDRIRQLAAVVEATRDGIFVIDPRFRLVTINEAFTRITGYAQSEIVGQNLRSLPVLDAARTLLPQIVRSVGRSGFWKGEGWARRKDGSLVPVLCSVNVLRDENGDLLNYFGVFTDITRLKETEQRLVELANVDELTGLPNRRKFVADLEAAIEATSAEEDGLAVHYLDLDDFKYVNDSYGHETGDRLLVAVAARLRAGVRETDVISRFGGDEFLILQPNVRSKLQASVLAERMRSCFEKPIEIEPGREIFIQTSIGISRFPTDGSDTRALISHADAAAYHAKRAGKGSYQFYEEAFTRASEQRLDIQAKMRGALARREFVVHYQPVVDLKRSLIGMEALVRWQRPGEGMVYPDAFIPIAEDTGLIFEIDRMVLFEACRQMRQWETQMLKPGIVSVNLSPRELIVDETETTIRSALEYSGLAPERLEIEVTETALMHSGDRGDRLLRSLKETLGIQIAIDDFGKGASSLGRLHEMPVDKIKIDRSFVSHIDESVEKLAICELMVVLAQKLGLTIQGEGVEREEELASLRKLGCAQFQGYLFGKPISPEAMEERLRDEIAANDRASKQTAKRS
ncbi:PAS domain S-box protein [Amorphus sp. 3PC139-8]|uniref:sensor domain-containing protein n=1 Tax=Amorphus sp. 3PC139-8 TaxID=2735676 RepID=UPI00345C6DEE